MRDMVSGAVLAGIVEQAKKQAIKRYLREREGGGEQQTAAGLTWADLEIAIQVQRDSLANQVAGMDAHALALTLGTPSNAANGRGRQ